MSRKLDRANWQVYFDRMSRVMDGKQAELEVESLDVLPSALDVMV